MQKKKKKKKSCQRNSAEHLFPYTKAVNEVKNNDNDKNEVRDKAKSCDGVNVLCSC